MLSEQLREMGLTAGIAELSLDEAIRIRGQSLGLTLSQIIQLRSVLYTLEATAQSQLSDLQVALHKAKTNAQ